MLTKSVTTILKTSLLTLLALTAFAANSILCRLALHNNAIDPASFTSIRLMAGALVLLLILKLSNTKNNAPTKGSWPAMIALFVYAVSFSIAYISLNTGTGALILFASVQITMILLSHLSGNRLYLSEWFGVIIAFFGFVYLVLPGVTAPSLTGFSFMTVAGIAWGVYTLKGRHSSNPLSDTAYNFTRSLPLVLILAGITFRNSHLSANGIFLALLSGGLMSGIGYTIWYSALTGLTATQAAVVQLFVPIIAALGGILFVSETISWRLILSAIIILSGIFLVITGRYLLVSIKQKIIVIHTTYKN